MALDDYLDSEVAIAVAATTALLSPRVRGVLRRGAVLGLAGALTAGDMLGSFARGVAEGVQQTAASTATAAQNMAASATAAADAAQTPPAEGGRRRTRKPAEREAAIGEGEGEAR